MLLSAVFFVSCGAGGAGLTKTNSNGANSGGAGLAKADIPATAGLEASILDIAMFAAGGSGGSSGAKSAASANTGNGGTGGNNSAGYAGGSGIVIIRFLHTTAAPDN